MFSLIGDISFNGLISSEPELNLKRFMFVSPLLKSDFVFANLEAPVKAENSFNEKKKLLHYSLPLPTKDLLKMLNIGCVSLANNHIYDCKMPGLRETIGILDELGIYHTGAGWKKEHIQPVIITIANKKIGFIAYVDRNTNPGTESFGELLINYFDPQKVLEDYLSIRLSVDLVICSIHWGTDYSNFFREDQTKIVHYLVDNGIDCIMGHHTHTLQSFEIYRGKPVFYSLGGLCYGDFIWEGKLRALKRKTKLGAIVFIDERIDDFRIVATKELKNNFIEIPQINIRDVLKTRHFWNELKNKYKIISLLIYFKESYIDRISEYFVGYHINPILQIFRIRQIFSKGYSIVKRKKKIDIKHV